MDIISRKVVDFFMLIEKNGNLDFVGNKNFPRIIFLLEFDYASAETHNILCPHSMNMLYVW